MPDALLDPAVLSAIGDLELVARVTVDGTVSGLHRSPFHGYSAEFSQYRHYRPGDDLKYIDWKLFARTDRIYTKQYRETTNMLAQVAVDASASMAYQRHRTRIETRLCAPPGGGALASALGAGGRRRPGHVCGRAAGLHPVAAPGASICVGSWWL